MPQQRRGPRDEAPLSEDRRTVRKLLDIVGHNCQTVGPGSKGRFTVDSQQIRDGFADIRDGFASRFAWIRTRFAKIREIPADDTRGFAWIRACFAGGHVCTRAVNP